MADYTNYNQNTGSKGLIVAICILAVFIMGLIFLGANAPRVDGGVAIEPVPSLETAPATGAIAPTAAD
jgi:hypothetical protein